MKKLLLIVDMQNGFVTEGSRHIIPVIDGLIRKFKSADFPVAFTRFINYDKSPWVKWIKWSRFMDSPEIDIIPELSQYADVVFDKKGLYTGFTNEFKDYIKKNEIQEIYLCGVATDGCVLKTAVDAFERGIEPIVIEDASHSHAGENVHQAGLLLISRFVGKNQIIQSKDLRL